MKENRLSIVIDRPVNAVFEFTLDPSNTPKWVEGIKQEESNEWPAKVGTIYRNESQDGVWRQYVLTELEQSTTFTLTSTEGNYSVRYSFKKVNDSSTEFEYFEWVDEGVLAEPFTPATLDKLKLILER